MVSFSDRATFWRESLMPATPQTKQAAKVLRLLLRGGRTASYDALEAAFRFDAEAIYFLRRRSERRQNPPPDAILKAVSQTNRVRRISIYTIGIAPGEAGGPLDTFMRTLLRTILASIGRWSQEAKGGETEELEANLFRPAGVHHGVHPKYGTEEGGP